MKNIVNSVEVGSYAWENLVSALRALLAPLGGLSRFVKPGMRVLINPNLLSARTPDRGVTTHPELVAAVASECVAAGAEVLIGDSPGGVEKGLRRVWNNTGMSVAAEQSSSRLVSFETGKVREVSVGEKKYHISDYAFDVDFIISLPKLKTHVLTNYTGAIKNCYGFIPGLRKSDYHKQNPDVKSFSNVVVDIYSIVKPGLFIMDAGMAMEGEGPASGATRWLGYLFAATDGVALDSAVVSLLGDKKVRVLPTEIAVSRGIGTGDLSMINSMGRAFENGVISDFKFPSNAYLNFIPTFLVKGLKSYLWVRPAIKNETCKMCGICVESCPQDVIYDKEGKLEFDYDRCIKCMCCHELCPHKSVFLQRSRLAKLIGK
ncbi:MAG: DUF362 domain-containing protein [candidate division Zixibacteria bacterium]